MDLALIKQRAEDADAADKWAARAYALEQLEEVVDALYQSEGAEETIWALAALAAYFQEGEEVPRIKSVAQHARMRDAIKAVLARTKEHSLAELVLEMRLEDNDL
jgi:hypothetical protein